MGEVALPITRYRLRRDQCHMPGGGGGGESPGNTRYGKRAAKENEKECQRSRNKNQR